MTLQHKLNTINIFQQLNDGCDVVGVDISYLDVNIAYRVVREWMSDNGYWVVEIK